MQWVYSGCVQTECMELCRPATMLHVLVAFDEPCMASNSLPSAMFMSGQ